MKVKGKKDKKLYDSTYIIKIDKIKNGLYIRYH